MDKTLQKLAADLGLSVMSVSRALQGRGGVSEETRERVRSAATAAGYRPNLIARALLTGRTNQIGILAADFGDPVTARMFAAVEANLRQRGQQALPGGFGDDMTRAAAVRESLMSQRVDGILTLETEGGVPDTITAGLTALPSVLVLLAESAGAVGPGTPTDRVVCEPSAAARASVGHLLSLGRKRLAFLSHGDEAAEARQVESWIAAHREAGIAPDASLRLHGVADARSAEQTIQRLLLQRDGDPIDAIVTTTGALAAGALHGCRRAGRSIGRRFQDSLSILCLIDSPVCAALDPSVTAFSAPFDDMATRSVEMLVSHIGSPSTWQPGRITCDARLVSRATA